MADEITLRATYLHPAGNASGSFLLDSEDVAAFDAWRTAHGIPTLVMERNDPATAGKLPVFGPLTANQLTLVETERNIGHGQRCQVTYCVKSRAGTPSLSFVDVQPEV